MQHVPPSQFSGAVRRGQQADIFSPLISIVMPRGKMDVSIRLATYANGSRALELRDHDGVAFYWPTLPCCPLTMLGLLSPEVADEVVVAIRASAVKNGIAHALMDAGLLADLRTEMPVDRHYASLMLLNMAMMVPDEPLALEAPRVDMVLKPMAVPAGWEPTARRVQQVFRKHGKAISLDDAMLAWAVAGGGLARVPPPLPPSGEELFNRLGAMFHAEGGLAP